MQGADVARWSKVVGVVAFLGLVTAACGGGSSGGGGGSQDDGGRSAVVEDDSDPVAGGSLVYALEAETDGFHPGFSRWAPSGLVVARSIFDTLAIYDENGEWQPWLAESFTPNDDFTEWVIKLRPGATFHDGSPVNAAAILANFEFHMDSDLTSVPFDPYDRENLEVIDDLTLRVPLIEPWVNLPNALTTQIGAIAHPELMQNVAEFSNNPVGSGPFILDSWTRQSQLVVQRNPNWWYEGYPLLDSVTFRPVPDGQTRASALRIGDVDVAMISDSANLADRDTLVERDQLQWFEDETGETNESMVMLNTARAPFNDRAAREALAYATPAQDMVDTLFDGVFAVSEGPFAAGSPYYAETEFPEYDLAEAVSRVEALGGLSFEILATADPASLGVVQFLADNWRNAGIEASVTSIEQTQFITTVLTGNYDATVWRQFDSPHPLGDSIWWICDSVTEIPSFALNFARNCNEEGIDDELDAARKTTDRGAEVGHYQAVMQSLARDLPYIWLYHVRIAFAARPNVRDLVTWTTPEGAVGLPVHGGSHPLYQVWLGS